MRKQDTGIKLCPSCNVLQDATKTECPNCGYDLTKVMNKNKSNVAASPKKQTFSWKTFIVAFIVAFFLNLFISSAAGVEPRKNITWTVLWIYLSIEAWKFWKWKALLPYPLYFVLNLIFLSVISATGFGNLSWSYISVALFLNIGGLITFYLLLRKSQHNQDIALDESARSPAAYATVVPVVANFSKILPPENHRTIPLQTVVNEERVYDEIAKELETGVVDKGLWTRLFVECGGDETQTKVLYIKQRAERLIFAKRAGMDKVTQEYSTGEKHSEVEKTDRNLLSPKNLEYENDDQESSILCGDNDDIRECPKCGMENRIQKISVGFIQKCDKCGNVDYFKEKEMDETSWGNRVLCSDKNCIGVIGKDGQCKICGKKGEVELPRNDRSK